MSFTHFDNFGDAVMVDVGGKPETQRVAVAKGHIRMNAGCFAAIKVGSVGKGDVLGVARIAGIMAVKRTAELIPLCHTLRIESAGITFDLLEENLEIEVVCTVKTTGQTGVEMEALTGVSVALLTVYDMCKAVDRAMEIGGIHLSAKTGGKSGEYRNERV